MAMARYTTGTRRVHDRRYSTQRKCVVNGIGIESSAGDRAKGARATTIALIILSSALLRCCAAAAAVNAAAMLRYCDRTYAVSLMLLQLPMLYLCLHPMRMQIQMQMHSNVNLMN